MYLAILIVTSIITGIIVTIVERKGFYPKPEKVVKVKKEKKKKKKEVVQESPSYQSDPVIMDAVTIMNMAPVTEDNIEILDDNYDVPVLVSSYTVDLSGVINNIQNSNPTEIKTDKNMNRYEGLV